MATNPGTTNLRAWWAMEEESGNRSDSHGSNTFVDNNSVLFSASGIQGNAADFEEGSSEYFSITDNADLSFGDEDFSLGLWYKPESAGEDGLFVKWNLAGGGSHKEYAVVRQAGGQIKFWISNNGSSESSFTSTTTANSNGTWYFIVCVHDSVGNTLGISINGEAIATTSYSSGGFDGSSPLLLGRWGASYMDALADESIIYAQALSQDDIDWLYNSGTGRTYAEAAGVSFVPFAIIF